MPVWRALSTASMVARQEIAGGMPSRASAIAHDGPSATIFSRAPAASRPRRAFFISPRICLVPWVKVPQVSVVTNTRADNSASSRPMPVAVIAATQNASSAAALTRVASISVSPCRSGGAYTACHLPVCSTPRRTTAPLPTVRMLPGAPVRPALG